MKKRKSNQESLGQVIERMLDVYKLSSGLTQLSLQSEWPKIVGTAIAERTTEVKLYGSQLIIRLNSPALRQELHYQQGDIRDNVNEFLGKEVVKEVLLR